jgi:pimeloyl-ACP methyl ester carboxylesterase
MSRHVRASDLRGYSRLAKDAVLGVTGVVEDMHHAIWRTLGRSVGLAPDTRAPFSDVVYGTIRGMTRLVGSGVDAMLAQLAAEAVADGSSAEREAVTAILNGVVGGHLETTANPLAIPMTLRQRGQPIGTAGLAGAAEIPNPTGKVLLLVHGLCMNDLQWRRNGHDHGAALAADAGFTPVYLHYNSGLHISVNGRAGAEQFEALLLAWPVPVTELVILGHSMGGLVARSACHYGKAAGHTWPKRLRALVFLGTPHHGAPLERGGNWVDAVLEAAPHTAALARLGKVRSPGITDLRHGSLLDEDWQDQDRFALGKDGRRPVPLPAGVHCYAIGGSLEKQAGQLSRKVVGDGLVPLDSALGRHRNPDLNLPLKASETWVGRGMNHLDLLDRAEVYERIRFWLLAPGKMGEP